MLNKLFFLIPFSVVIGWGLSSCRSHDNAHNVTITINQPTANQVYAPGDSVIIDATLTSDAEMHGWAVKIVPVGSSTPLFEEVKHTHGMTLNLHTGWVNNVATETQAEVVIGADLNHTADNMETKKVPIVLKNQ